MKETGNHIVVLTADLILGSVKFILIVLLTLSFLVFFGEPDGKPVDPVSNDVQSDSNAWTSPRVSSISENENHELIAYGHQLIINTDTYLGPAGSVTKANGMRCTNCHLDGGTKYFGNNFSAVASTYPKYRPRYGNIESIEMRVNDCIVRSLNGQRLDHTSREMKAIVAYMHWLGSKVKKGVSPPGAGLQQIPYLQRAASPVSGELVYIQKCASCHGVSGQGMMKGDSSSWLNPPLWGNQSYTSGAGMYRLGRLASFVKANMPWGTSVDAPQLTDEEAWDVAAYINSMPRTEMDLSKDWPRIAEKPIDYPFGPYVDTYSEEQHKYGPYTPMIQPQEKSTNTKARKKEKATH